MRPSRPTAAVEAGQVAPSSARDSSIVAAWTLVSRVSGLARVVCVGAILGPTFLANVYQSTNALPNVVYELLTGSLFAAMLVPPLVRAMDAEDVRGAERIAGGFLGVALLGFLATAVAVVAAGPVVMSLLGVGITDTAVLADQRRIGVLLLALIMPQLLFYGLAGTAAAAQNARGRFALPAAAPALENLGIVATLLVFAGMGAMGREINEVTNVEIFVLGAGTTAAVALHAGAQWWGARRAGVTLVPRAGWRDPEVRRLLRSARPALGHSGLSAVLMLGWLVVASGVSGGVVAYAFALNFFHLVTALTARPVATVLLPAVSRLHHAGDRTGLRSELDRSLSLVASLAVPATCSLVALAGPLSWAVTFGAMATPRGERLVAVALAAVSVGLVAEAAFILFTATSYGQGRPSVPFHGMIVRAGVTVLGMLLTIGLVDGTGVLMGLGLSKAAGDICAAAYLAHRVLSTLPAGAGLLGPVVGRGLLVGATMGAAGLAVALSVRASVAGAAGDVLAASAAAVTASLCFVVLHRVLRSPELMPVLSGRGRRRS